MSVELGDVVPSHNIQSSLAPFQVAHGYKVAYPPVVIEALVLLFAEYNQAFEPLVESNREWEADYAPCFGVVEHGGPVNHAVQVDMNGLSDELLADLSTKDVQEVVAVLRERVFELDNSLAMYALLRRLFESDDVAHTLFKQRFDSLLASLRRRNGRRPIALLAPTHDKYAAMLASEFGIFEGDVPDEVVKSQTGFDRFFGPDAFKEHLEANGGECKYLLYVRPSNPVAKIKNPRLEVPQPLLGDPAIREVIKANAVTLCVDAPDMDRRRQLLDTKAYMLPMGLAHPIDSLNDVYHGLPFRWYVAAQGLDVDDVMKGKVKFRAKPLKGTYGCYGHVTGALTDPGFRQSLAYGLRLHGWYLIQPEQPPLVLADSRYGDYHVIDRVFVGILKGRPDFLGGFRSLMPANSHEAQQGRNHGNGHTVWAEIKDR